MRRRALLAASISSDGVGLSAVLTPGTTGTNMNVFNYILANSTTYSVGIKDWVPCEADDIVITGSFYGNVLNRAKVLSAICFPGEPYFNLEWEGQSIWHYATLHSSGLLDMGDDS